ncbi:MFS transporter [Ramlibacter sp.]|uniref:MFS transporter n=1 Tax=Ramlibacter sp. TaxID=1917967 RepID=UPI003D123F52
MTADPLVPRPWLALQATLAAQLFASFVTAFAPVVAPAVAPQLGIAPERVGLFTATIYLVAMLSGVACASWMGRVGALRSTQVVLVCIAGGIALAGAGTAAMLLLAAVVIGIGHGVVNPAAAVILGRHAPPGSPGLFFAIKQAGVPAGIALAGLVLPATLATIGWQAALFATAAALVALAVVLIPARPLLDPPSPKTSPARQPWVESLLHAAREPSLRRLSFMAMAYATMQLGFVTYAVSLLVRLGLPLAQAAGMLAIAQLASVITRVTAGHIADRWFPPRRLLSIFGFAMAAASVGLAFLPASPSVPLVGVVMVIAGATAMGWNGVFFAELVRVVPRDQLARAAGGTQFFLFGGSMLGPFLFSQLLAFGGTYTAGFLALAVLAALAAVTMLGKDASNSDE